MLKSQWLKEWFVWGMTAGGRTDKAKKVWSKLMRADIA